MTTAKHKAAAKPEAASAPVATAEPAPAIATMAPPAGANPMVVFDAAQLPEEVTTTVKSRGTLVDESQLGSQQRTQAKQIVEKFNLNDTTAVLTFAAPPQQAVSAFLDTLMGDIKVRDAGIAGDMAKQMAWGIDLMQLDKVKQQISGVRKGLLSSVAHFVTGSVNYLLNFYAAQQPIKDMIDKMARNANNRMVTLDGHVKKLDQLADQSVVQVRALAAYIFAGEIILVQAREQYQKRREVVLNSHDVVEASRLRDMGRQVAALEKRVLETEIAYTNAGNVTIPQIRMVQEADRIEIQNISEQILFQLPKFKTAVIMMAALADTKAAADDRKRMDENEKKLDVVLSDTIAQTNRIAKESQGDPLQKVVELEQNISKIEAMIKEQLDIEAKTHGMREEAHDRIVQCKDTVGNALKSANLASATA